MKTTEQYEAEINQLKEDVAAAKSSGDMWEQDFRWLCKALGIEFGADDVDCAADWAIHAIVKLTAEVKHAKTVCSELLGEIRAYQGEGEFEEGSATKDHCDLLKSVINYQPSEAEIDDMAQKQALHEATSKIQ